MESKRGEGRKSVIDAVSQEDGDVSEILFSLDSKIVELPVSAKAPQVEEAPYEGWRVRLDCHSKLPQ